MRKYIYKMKIDCGRDGVIKSTFISTENEMNALIGRPAIFFEPFGKHSEISGELESNHFERVDCTEEAVKVVEDLGILPVGFYPFDAALEEDNDLE